MDNLNITVACLLFLLKACIAASVDLRTFMARLNRKGGMAIGIACQFVILPFCGFCITKVLKLQPIYGIPLMVIMTSPGGSYSNWWCSIFNVDVSMSIIMTGVSTVLGVIMLPVNLSLYGMLLYGKDSFTSENFKAVVVSLAIILLALCVGLGVSCFLKSQKARDGFSILANLVGVSLLILSIFVSSHQSNTPVWRKPAYLHAAVAMPLTMTICLTLFVSSLPALRLTKPERIAVVMEACYQNPGLAISIVIAMFSGKDVGDAVAVPILYGAYEALLLGLLCLCAHYFNWTFVDPSEMSLVDAMKGNFQNRACDVPQEDPRLKDQASRPWEKPDHKPAEDEDSVVSF